VLFGKFVADANQPSVFFVRNPYRKLHQLLDSPPLRICGFAECGVCAGGFIACVAAGCMAVEPARPRSASFACAVFRSA